MAATKEYQEILKNIKTKAEKEKKENKRLFKNFKTDKPKGLDKAFQLANDKAFSHINCLECGNCCRIAQPVFERKDIRVLAKHFKITANEFINKYLKKDKVYEFLTKKLLCPFLGGDNKCTVYEVRPAGCRTYPPAKLRLTPEQLYVLEENIGICPAVNEMVETIKDKFASLGK